MSKPPIEFCNCMPCIVRAFGRQWEITHDLPSDGILLILLQMGVIIVGTETAVWKKDVNIEQAVSAAKALFALGHIVRDLEAEVHIKQREENDKIINLQKGKTNASSG